MIQRWSSFTDEEKRLINDALYLLYQGSPSPDDDDFIVGLLREIEAYNELQEFNKQ